MFKQLEFYRAVPRRGQLTMIAAAPGGGKSALVTYLSLFSVWPDGQPLRVLYFSADSDKMTYGIRAAASAMDIHTVDAEDYILSGEPGFLAELDSLTNNIWVDFDSSPSPTDIDSEMEAYAVVNGCYPEMVVVDNLMDVNVGGGRDKDSDDAVLDFLKRLARRTSSAVVVLVHVTGAWTNGEKPIPRDGLMNKIDKRPRLIMTLYNDSPNTLGVCVVKNSNGPADAEAQGVVAYIPVVWEKVYFGRGN